MKGIGGGIVGAAITTIAFLGTSIGALVGKCKKLPEISVVYDTIYEDQDNNTEAAAAAVRIEEEHDEHLVHLYEANDQADRPRPRPQQLQQEHDLLTLQYPDDDRPMPQHQLITF